jgi:predicted DNA-binding helix-hairpin-helix protein
LPTEVALEQLAPQKDFKNTEAAMSGIRDRIVRSKAERRESRKAPAFAPAGQSTQMIVGATDTPDATILAQATSLYAKQKLRRVYYSAFSPIPDASSALPLIAPPLAREHRLYQADWLVRFYGFQAHELTTPTAPNLDLAVDPKLAWALRNRHVFPVDLNKATRDLLLRVPGLGTKSVDKYRKVRPSGIRLRRRGSAAAARSVKKVLPFIITATTIGESRDRSRTICRRVAPPPRQLDLFAASRRCAGK